MGNSEGMGNMEDTGVGEMMILNWILKKSVGRAFTGLIWLRRRTSGWVSNNE
jgi:hypothetical protein